MIKQTIQSFLVSLEFPDKFFIHSCLFFALLFLLSSPLTGWTGYLHKELDLASALRGKTNSEGGEQRWSGWSSRGVCAGKGITDDGDGTGETDA